MTVELCHHVLNLVRIGPGSWRRILCNRRAGHVGRHCAAGERRR